jgi:rhodanese-related sulfurtransferase/DNA-binding HxlR family transcriptional regulator
MNSLNHREFKDQMYEQFARIVKALGNPRRLEIVDLLAQGERTVEEIARETSLSIANASQHLQTLRSAHLVEVRRDGLYAYYRLTDENVFRVWQSIRTLGETHLAEIDRIVRTFLEDRDDLAPVSAQELIKLSEASSIVVLDVRPDEEYRAGHIPGARSMPIDKLESYLKQLPNDKEVIAYCRGPYCVFADEAVALLRERGYKARRYDKGLPDWRASGLPVEISP